MPQKTPRKTPEKTTSPRGKPHAAKGSKGETNVLIDSSIYRVAQERVPVEEEKLFKRTGIRARVNVSSVINQALRAAFGMPQEGRAGVSEASEASSGRVRSAGMKTTKSQGERSEQR